MILDNITAQYTAEFLLQINAIKLNSENYFTWASGWKSPIYCDNRIILSFPEVRNYIANTMATYIKKPLSLCRGGSRGCYRSYRNGNVSSQCTRIALVYVRPEPKKHGRQNQIEGLLSAGQQVIVIEDLIRRV